VAVLTRIDTPQVAERLGLGAERSTLEQLRLQTVLHVPVMVRERVWAVLTLGTADSGRRFSEADLSLAEEISTRIRLAVENAMLLAEAQQEIQERRRAERTVRETREQLELFVEGARDYAMFLMDADRRITAWNHGAERILGFSEREAVGMSADQIFDAEDRAAGVPEKEIALAIREGAAPDERWHVRKDGTRFWASGHLVTLRDESGVRGFAKIMRDLTGMKLTEEELEQRVRRRTFAHDLRSPLRSIQSFTQFTIEEAAAKLSVEERGYLDRVQRAAARLDRLISDLLVYSRVSKTRVELAPVNLCRLIGAICREHEEFCPPRAEVRIDGTLGTVLGNEAYLTQTVTNLLGNAVKFVAPERSPDVRIWSERRGSNLRVHFQDNGIGIAPEHHARIFDIFERLHRHGTYEGTGVGLAIVRRAVQRMNGSVGVESRAGGGAVFWVELPAADAERAAPAVGA
jgi:PAS domain S-box-containing protein